MGVNDKFLRLQLLALCREIDVNACLVWDGMHNEFEAFILAVKSCRGKVGPKYISCLTLLKVDNVSSS